jgi:hypothetical protein
MVSDGAKVSVLLGTLIPGIILLFITIFTLNLWAMIFGFILFAIGIGMWGYASGSRRSSSSSSSSNRSPYDANGNWHDVYMERWGSANAKRNMWRGHRYSSRKRR